MWARTRGFACLFALLVAVATVVWPASPAVAATTQAAPPAFDLPAGTLLLALPALGQVNAIRPDGSTQVLARGLSGPSAVAVLADGTIVVAESGADRISALGGAYGVQPQPIAEVPAPNGLVAASDGSVYVTAAGQVGRLEVTARRYQTLASGFASPLGPALDGTRLYVPDPGTGRIATLDTTTGAELGDAAVLAAPGGAAAAPGAPLFVAQTQGPGVARVDAGGVVSSFATVPGALQLAFDPPAPGADDWILVVVTQTGLTRLSSDGRVVGDRLSLAGIGGVAAVPELAAHESAEPVSVGDPAGSSSAPAWLWALVGVGLLVAGGLAWWLARRGRGREREDDGFMPPPSGTPATAPASGGCDRYADDVDRLEQLVRDVTSQLDDVQAHRRRSSESASGARDRAMRALEVRTSVRTQRLAARPRPPQARLSWSQLSFRTSEGRAVVDAFRRRQVDAVQLKARLAELGEASVIDQIAGEGRHALRTDPEIPWPEERQATRDAIAARDELRHHQREVDEAGARVAQLAARRAELTDDLDRARRLLDDCRRANATAGRADS
jgi:DNA-binding beta-propeller fold protein YncE